MIYQLEIPDNKVDFANEFFKNISFVKNVRVVEKNEITNTKILKSIDACEKGEVKPTPLNLSELKTLINA